MADLVIANGLIVDGTGAPPYTGDVRIAGDRIASVSREVDRMPAAPSETIDATGLMVTPGFIDIHSHSDHTLLVDPRAYSSLKQGVTLEVVGNCGFGCFPVEEPQLARSRIYAYHDAAPISWRSAEGYFGALEAAQPAINVASLVPNGQLRLAVMGPEERAATGEERRSMRRLLDESLEAGAWGLSTCLESGEESSMTEDEVADLCRSVAAAGGIHAAHTRNRADRAAEAIEEAIRTAATAQARLQISHLIPDGGMADLERCLAAVEGAAGGQDVSFDMHTRLFGIGYLSAAVPPPWLRGAPDEVASRLRDPERRRELRGFHSALSAIGDWDRVVLLDNEIWPDYGRRSIGEIARSRGTEPIDAVCDLLAASADDVSRLWTVELTFTEEEQRLAFVHPRCVPASDAAALGPDGPLATRSFHGAYSWASWFYRYMVRERRLLSPEAAIEKLTRQPASILGLRDRGTIAVGALADVAIFDPATFAERETLHAPNQAAVGMRHVLVNGALALSDGAPTDRRSGSVLRRG
jgi:N-acyl-D-aspartate/D-glutamate deacylase